MLNSVETIKTINTLTKNNIPFLFIIDFEKESNLVLPLDELSQNGIFYEIPDSRNFSVPVNKPVLKFFHKTPVSFIQYQALFNKVTDEIKRGNTFLLNLTVPTQITSNLNLYEIFLVSQAKYKLYYKDNFTLFSPESFLSIENGIIKTFPMKGTIK